MQNCKSLSILNKVIVNEYQSHRINANIRKCHLLRVWRAGCWRTHMQHLLQSEQFPNKCRPLSDEGKYCK